MASQEQSRLDVAAMAAAPVTEGLVTNLLVT